MSAAGTRRVAVVTGGSAGIGRAAVRCLAERGWDVGVIAREQGRPDETVAAMSAAGRRAVAVSADVSDADALDEAANRIEAELGPIDVWVNTPTAARSTPSPASPNLFAQN